MHDFARVFQKLDTRHKAEWISGPISDPCAQDCEKRASDIVAARKGFFVLLITGATMYTLLAWWLS